MKLTIKSNGTIHAVNVDPKKIYDPESSDLFIVSDEVNSVEIDFTPPQLWSDFELWLEDGAGQIIDYKKINLSRRNKLQMST